MKPYKLMTSLFGHTGDVKGLYATKDNGGFVSVSRDLTAKLWKSENNETNHYIQYQTITEHKKYVNSVVVVYTLEEYPNGVVLTGSNDKTIAVHNIESNELLGILEEHEGSVCTLYFDNDSKSNILYSGSFDSSAKVWELNNLVKSNFKLKSSITIKGHDQTVWGVLGISKQGVVLTASADKSIKHWQLDNSYKNPQNICKYIGHTDCVRGIALNSKNDQEFFTCSNDGYVLNWRLTQTNPLKKIRVTDSFLYSINMLITNLNDQSNTSDCYFITSGEDRCLRIHSASEKSESTIQTIALPCQTLWYTICLPNGNIAVACSDGTIRLFTQNEKIMANASEIAEYERELSQFTIPLKSNQAMSQINRTELPGVEALTLPGKRDGQTLMINNGSEAEVYQWDGAENRWIKIGVAVGSSDGGGGSRQKTSYLGKEYDYVFDIELDEGGAKLKLPFNLSEDPYFAAQKFIHKHELSQTFLDQIAQFLITNTQNETIGSNSSVPYVDPFTGEGRYVPQIGTSASSSQKRPNSSYVDPFTGGGAYHSNSNKKISDYQMETEPSIRINTPQSNEFYPVTNFILFDQINIETILKKLKEFQQQIGSEHKNELISDKNNIELIEHLMNNYETLNISTQLNDQIDLLFQMIEVWPIDHVFPLIDLLRILVLNKDFINYICRNQNLSYLSNKQAQPLSNNYFETLFKLMVSENPVVSMLVLRVLSNLFKTLNDLKSNQKVLSFILNERIFLLKRLEKLLDTQNKNLQTSISTVVLNYAILFGKLVNYSEKLTNAYITDQAREHIEYLNEPLILDLISNWDAEALFRILVCIGTILSDTNAHYDVAILISIVQSTGNFKKLCDSIMIKSEKFPDKVKKCNNYLKRLIE